jgi:hypothetical protein
MTTKILGNQITNFTIDTVQLSNTATAAFAKTLAPKVLYANVANSLYYTLDDTAVNVGGGYIVVTGAEFQSGATVLIDTTPASAVTFVNSTTLQVQVPTKSAASYNLYVVNPDGGVGIKVSGLTYSTDPAWVTSSPLSNQVANTAFNVTLSATGATSYAVAAGSTLPAGTSLAANGYFSGTVSIGAETTYSFSVVATDAELQDSSKTFQVTVTVIPARLLYITGPNARLSAGSDVSRSSPTQIGTDNWQDISRHAQVANNGAGIKTDGTLWTWTNNGYGEAGQNNSTFNGFPSSPVQVGADTNWSKINSFGGGGFAAIKTTGTLWTWGSNDLGEAGQNAFGSSNRRSSPTQVGTGTNWSKISGSGSGNGAIKTDGTLWVWGSNTNGATGQNDSPSNNRSSPTQVGTGTDWSEIAGGYEGFYAIKTNGTLWAWGRGLGGRLGLNHTNYRSSPTQVGTDTNWSKLLAEGCTFQVALKTNGTLWSWGQNYYGNLGLNDTANRSSPTQIGALTTWLTGGGGYGAAGAIKTDGTLWTWGDGANGKLGSNNLIARSSPVQVGASTSWSNVYGSQNGFYITSG